MFAGSTATFRCRSSGPHNVDVVGTQLRLTIENDAAFFHRLHNEHAIERI